MNWAKRISLFGFLFIIFGCNQNQFLKEKPANIIYAFDSIDTIDYNSVLSFDGEVKVSKFGVPGEEYKKGDTLPNRALILELTAPKSFYYRNETDSLSYSFYKEYNQFQLLALDSTMAKQLNDLVGQRVTLEGSVFQGLTMHYIRELAININKIK